LAKVNECGTSVPSWVISRFDFRDVEAIQSNGTTANTTAATTAAR
jgi:hypothetical protein